MLNAHIHTYGRAYVFEGATDGKQERVSSEVLKRANQLSYDETSTWEELQDPNTGRVFFYSRSTGLSQWERPDELLPTSHMRGRSKTVHFDSSSNWEALRDPETQVVFYYNRATGE
jgi:hypothetical protein